jgi:hypothetical protein
MLDAFVRIESEQDIADFAVRWGVLWICAHGYPSTHAEVYEPVWNSDYIPSPAVDPCFPEGRWVGEPVGRWFVYSRAARSILNVAAAIHSGSIGRSEDWVQAFGGFDLSEDIRDSLQPDMWQRVRDPMEDAPVMVADLINEWLRLGNVRPRLEWEVGAPRFEFDAATFGAIGVQLMHAVTRGHGLTICSSCGRPYLRQGRKAPKGRRNYCPDCGPAAALRDAQRAHRARRGKVEQES